MNEFELRQVAATGYRSLFPGVARSARVASLTSGLPFFPRGCAPRTPAPTPRSLGAAAATETASSDSAQARSLRVHAWHTWFMRDIVAKVK